MTKIRKNAGEKKDIRQRAGMTQSEKKTQRERDGKTEKEKDRQRERERERRRRKRGRNIRVLFYFPLLFQLTIHLFIECFGGSNGINTPSVSAIHSDHRSPGKCASSLPFTFFLHCQYERTANPCCTLLIGSFTWFFESVRGT